MHEEVKQAVQTGDIKRLKYIFVDSLDVDPTFENYREDFDYCVKHNIFENHEVLTKLQKDSSNWTFDYWKYLKKDLTKNFSKKRMEHMIEVARVIYKEKVERLKKERTKSSNSRIEEPVKEEVRLKASNGQITQNSSTINSIQEEERRRLEEARKKIEEENRAIERKMAEQRARTEAMRRASEEAEAKRQQESENGFLKDIATGAVAFGGAIMGLHALFGNSPKNPKAPKNPKNPPPNRPRR